VKIERVIRRVSEDGRSVLNAAVAANIGETGEAGATSVQHVEIVQHIRPHRGAKAPTDKES